MSALRRIARLFTGIVMILFSVLVIALPEDGYVFVVFCTVIACLLYGIRLLMYYLTMARYMVGGIMTFYKSIIAIDFGMFIFFMDQLPKRLTMLYLVGLMGFNGIVVILNALDAKRLEVSSWKYKFVYGAIKVLLTVVCLFFLDSEVMMTYVYCIGLLHSALYSIVSAFRKSAIIHIS